MISAEVILDSISPQGHRLTTFKLRYPRFIHAEFMTHRVFSRNASSSRAVPVKKRIEEAADPVTRAYPEEWGKNRPGMSAIEKGNEVWGRANWDAAAEAAVHWAQKLSDQKLHKQIVNRILEPFIHIDVVVTATEYMNFFGLRLDGGADPTIRALADEMWRLYTRVHPVPQLLQPGDWHLPFVDEDSLPTSEMIKISVARCARVSYMSHETGKRSTIEEDLRLYERLVGSHPLHASPAEHQATPDQLIQDELIYHEKRWDHPEQHGNFTGWRQYRKLLENETVAPLPEKYR